MKPHKHAELIKAWASGAEIERHDSGRWLESKTPTWSEKSKYRIKPETKPDVILFETVHINKGSLSIYKHGKKNLKLTFDGETGKLKSAEVMK